VLSPTQQMLLDQAKLFEALPSGRVVPFPQPVAQSNPLNASPYLISKELFRSTFGREGHRKVLMDALDEVMDRADAGGFDLVALLVGGSVLAVQEVKPKDVDCVYFYRVREGLEASFEGLASLAKEAQQRGIDIRFIPYDANPLLALKACSFFTMIYGRTRRSAELTKGCVLVHP
jgi:hypothetical protein